MPKEMAKQLFYTVGPWLSANVLSHSPGDMKSLLAWLLPKVESYYDKNHDFVKHAVDGGGEQIMHFSAMYLMALVITMREHCPAELLTDGLEAALRTNYEFQQAPPIYRTVYGTVDEP